MISMNIKRADEIYENIKNKLKGKEGKIVAIDTDTGDYFIGEDILEAYEKGSRKYPGKEFFFHRIGAKATFHVL
jgi:hypothetical protein